jgi:outer membrane protein assembly factor BamB
VSLDRRLRELERRCAADPSDTAARLALALALLRAGRLEAAHASVPAHTGEGFRALVAGFASEPGLAPLLDGAPAWATSGGDPGCSRWSRAEAVLRPRTAWWRRIEGVQGALAVASDRGRAFVLALTASGPELVALSVLTGETLWRARLGRGPAAAPAARGGVVFAACHDEGAFPPPPRSGGGQGWGLRVRAFDGATGTVKWETVEPAEGPLVPGALNFAASTRELIVPVASTARGSSTVPDARTAAFILVLDEETGAGRGAHEHEQVSSEVAARDGAFLAGIDFARRAGEIGRFSGGRGPGRPVLTLDGAPSFLAFAGRRFAVAVGGRLTVKEELEGDSEWSTQGGAITSLALDPSRVLVGRGMEFAVRDVKTGASLAAWQTAESPLPFAPRGTAQAPPSPRSAVVASDTAYLASPLFPSVSAFAVASGEPRWRHALEGLLVPEDGPRFSWPTAELGPPDRGPLHLVPLPGLLLGITLSGYAFLIEDSRSP